MSKVSSSLLAASLLLAMCLGDWASLFSADRGIRPRDTALSQRETVDRLSVAQSEDGRRSPAYSYDLAVSLDGSAYVLKRPTGLLVPLKLDGERNAKEFANEWREYKRRLYSEVQIIVAKGDNPAETVQIDGWGPFIAQNGPQLFIQNSGQPLLLWSIYDHQKLDFVGVAAKRRLGANRWSEPFTLTDDPATGVSSYTLIEPLAGQLELLWTDKREKHFVAWWLPFEEAGYPKLFSRALTSKKQGSEVRITKEKGRYRAENVRARSDKSGRSFAVWDQTSSKGLSQVFMSSKSHGSSWSRPLQVSEDRPPLLGGSKEGGNRNLPNTHLAFDVIPLGDADSMVLWVDFQNEGYLRCRRFQRGKLGPILTIASGLESFEVAPTSTGSIHLIYESAKPVGKDVRTIGLDQRPLYHRRWSNGAWSDPEELAEVVFTGSSKIQVDGNDRIHFIWLQSAEADAELVHTVRESDDAPVTARKAHKESEAVLSGSFPTISLPPKFLH